MHYTVYLNIHVTLYSYVYNTIVYGISMYACVMQSVSCILHTHTYIYIIYKLKLV